MGTAVRLQRTHLKLSRLELADATGRSSSMITRIERGEVGLSLETLEKLAVALQVEVRDLFPSTDGPVRAAANEPLENLVRRISNLGPEDMKWIDDVVRVALARKVRHQPSD